MKRGAPSFALAAAAGLFGAAVLAQPAPQAEFAWPERIENAEVLPADIGAERLRRTMVGFARGLGVRCTFCHVGEEGAPLATLDFVSDANPHKEIARGMIRMTARLNSETLSAILGPGEGPRVTCFTCHRGESRPATMPPPAPPAPSGERGGG